MKLTETPRETRASIFLDHLRLTPFMPLMPFMPFTPPARFRRPSRSARFHPLASLVPLLCLLSTVGLGAAASVTPTVAWAQEVETDSDGDGVPDVSDVRPCDAGISALVFAPAEDIAGSLLFEDLWPRAGDLDFNDAVITYNYVYRLRPTGHVASLKATFNVLAIGAAIEGGFGLHLPVPRTSSGRVTLTVEGETPFEITPLEEDGELTVRLIENLRYLFQDNPEMINTRSEKPKLRGKSFVVEFEFATPVVLSAAGGPHDAFIYYDSFSHQIHPPQYEGTSQMDQSLFGTYDDGSTPGRRFVDKRGLPFSLAFPSTVEYPLESEEISRLFPDIVSFATSGGASHQNFYETNVRLDFAYRDAEGGGPLTPVPPAPEPRDTACIGNPGAVTVSLDVLASADEGAVWTARGVFDDPIGGAHTATVDFGDGSRISDVSLNTDRTFDLSHVYRDDGVYRVSVVVVATDSGRAGEGEVEAVVQNVAPVVILGEDLTIDAGASITRLGSIVDPGADTIVATVDFGEGAGSEPLLVEDDGGFVIEHTYFFSGTYRVTVEATDDDGARGERFLVVTVDESGGGYLEPPVVTLAVPGVALEGSSVALTGMFSDNAGPHTASIDFGDGALPEMLSIGMNNELATTHVFANNGSYTVELTITDPDGNVGRSSQTVVVDNVPPTVSAGPDAVIRRGETLERTGTILDPGSDLLTGTVDYGDGAGPTALIISGREFVLSHTYTASGSFTVTVLVNDGDVTAIERVQVTVENVAIMVSLGADATIDEGSVLTRAGSFLAPPGADIVCTVNYGDGAGDEPLTLSGGTFSLRRTYTRSGAYTVTVAARDEFGGQGSDSFIVTVRDVPPVLMVDAIASARAGTPLEFRGTITDPGEDAFRLTIDAGPRTIEAGPFTSEFSVPFTYDAPSPNVTVQITATDVESGASVTQSLAFRVDDIACPAGRANCNASAGDGCEADITTAAQCGACGQACGAAEICTAGVCVTHCSDGSLNGDEAGVDCGGSCPTACPSCVDGLENGDEAGVDCGGSCPTACPSCVDGIQNGDEAGVDCGGACGSSCSGCTGASCEVGPEISLRLSRSVIARGESVTIQVTATDPQGVVDLTLTAGGVALFVDVSGFATFTPSAQGLFEVVAEAYDGLGNFAHEDLELRVTDPGDTTYPVVAIVTPANDATLVSRTDFTGTASDANLEYYELAYRLKSETEWTTAFRGTSPVTNGLLGRLDTGVMENGLYDVRLLAADVNGHQTSMVRSYRIDGLAKVGIVSMTIRDLEVPVGGLPITIDRTYDSRVKTGRDFGVGWSLDVRQGRFESNRPSGEGWQVQQGGGFFKWPCDRTAELATHRTEVRLSYNERYVFALRASPTSQLPITSGFCQVALSYDFVSGTLPGRASLQIIGSNTAVFPIGSNHLAPDIIEPNEVYEVESVRLTTPDGRRVSLTRSGGTYAMSEPNGNQLTIDDDGVRHSSGKEIRFERDAEGRIIEVRDPLGQVTTYAYDAHGDLVSVTDPTGAAATYRYDDAHYLLEARDATGRTMRHYEYDESGRVVAVVDGRGNRTEFTRDLDARREIVMDALGGLTTYLYDARGNVLERTDPLGQVWTQTYDANDRMLTSTDPDGRVTRQEYGTDGHMTRYVDPMGHTVSWTADTAGRVTSQTDMNGEVTNLTYDTRGNLLTLTDPEGHVQRNTYNASGNLISETKLDGSTWSYAYDVNGNRTRETDPLGNVTTTTYDASGNKTSTTNLATGRTTRFAYDGRSRLTQTIHPDGSETRTEYGPNGRKSAEIDALGHRTEFAYDVDGNLTETRYPDGARTVVTFDALGRWLTRTDEAGRVTRASYDALGRRTEIVRPDGSSMRWVFDANGRMVEQIDERGNVTAYSYDDSGRNTRIVDALGNVRQQTFDAYGSVMTATDSLGNVMSYEYDGNMRRTRETLPDGAHIASTFDGEGRVLTRTDHGGQVTSYTYDAAGRLVGVRDALGNSAVLAYDPHGDLTSMTDANGHETTYEYDISGRVLRIVKPMGQVDAFAYDDAGNVIEQLDATGAQMRMNYDARNRLVSRVLSSGEVETFTYTPTGQRATVTDARGTTQYTYDLLDRLVRRTDPDGVTLAYGYDAHGNVTQVAAGAHVLEYSYDALDRVLGVRALGGETSYAYDAAGRLVDIGLPNGVRTSYTHDGSGRVLSVERVDSRNQLVARYGYTLDSMGRRSRVTEGHSGRVTTYGYDALSRLIEETIEQGGASRQIQYAYDGNGNRVQKDDSTEGVVDYTYDANDRLVAAGIEAFAFDARGNVVGRTGGSDTIGYAYDAHNRLQSVTRGSTQVQYVYDVDGHRVRRIVNGVPTRLVVDANRGHAQVVAERDGSGADTALFAHGHGLVALDAGEGVRFAHGDASRSVRQLTDDSGAVTDTYDYDAFGVRLSSTGSSFNPYGYQGEYLDEAAGLYFLRARWLDVEQGRFTSVDPVAPVKQAPTTFNRYVYALNDPVNRIDPSGEFSMVSVSISISIVAVGANGLGLYGFHTNAVEREKAMLNRTNAFGVWGMGAALAISTAGGVAATSFDPAGSLGGGKADAVRHCTWNGIMAMVIGQGDAAALATAHEDPFPKSPNNINDKAMDMYNNAMGRSMGMPVGIPYIFRTTFAGIGALVAWPGAAGGCIGMLYAGQLQVLDQSYNPWKLVPSDDPSVP
ncbi:MAG: LruC domain-containing protein [Deltaproteobacteria bacterium]|nr:LruC domain-containing protein [Deltaproteobacteria bacterium]